MMSERIEIEIEVGGQGLRPSWISDVLKSAAVTSLVERKGQEVLRSLEAKTRSNDLSGGPNFGSKVLSGIWGKTVVIWPRTFKGMSAKPQAKSTLASAGLIVNPKKRGL